MDRPGCFQLPQPTGAGCPDAARDPNRSSTGTEGRRPRETGLPGAVRRGLRRAKSIPEDCVPHPSSSPPPRRIRPGPVFVHSHRRPGTRPQAYAAPGSRGPDPGHDRPMSSLLPRPASRLLRTVPMALLVTGAVLAVPAPPAAGGAPTRRPTVSGRWRPDPRWRPASTRPTHAGAPVTGAWTWWGIRWPRSARRWPARSASPVGSPAAVWWWSATGTPGRRTSRCARPSASAIGSPPEPRSGGWRRRAPTASRPPACTGAGCAARSTSTP